MRETRQFKVQYSTSSRIEDTFRRCYNSSVYFYLGKQQTYSTSSSYTILTPNTHVLSFGLRRKHGSVEWQSQPAEAHSTDLPSVSASVYRPAVSHSVLAARFLIVVTSTSTSTSSSYLTPFQSSIQQSLRHPDIPRPSPPNYLPAIDQTHGRTTRTPTREIANKLQIKRLLFRLPDQTNGRRTVHHPN